jgi:mannose-6-phosphate isomerase-like protein (cupin superfamily)
MDEILHITTDETKEFLTEERCHIIELLNNPEDRSSSIARARVEPDVTTAWHRLKDTAEMYYILEGEGLMEIGEDYTQRVAKNDIIKIPRNTSQRITNTGIVDLVFLCFCVPAFGVENYEGLE